MIQAMFKKLDARALREAQLNEAETLHLQHLAAAEYYAALAEMYGKRADRLRQDDDGCDTQPFRQVA